ncbi:MAG: pyridine nucleotide-disulfide oxidoreductase [Neptuniibacter caesariensis]|uniref:Pyridine nucleotide-disulfide oxidoreductase n=1 Tax=Neptuniibacter caesariensis TaxID=207954 RepID=A0A2G6JAZ3_NEPCE|nr:MAG: pyridine nucleotide-disulfide oxidoreductase [Neptuniibacter caesariensis]
MGDFSRRSFLKLGAAAGVSAATPLTLNAAETEKIKSKAHIVIAGAGAAGLATANRLASQLDGAKITIIDNHKKHFYQPGFTLVAAGIKDVAYPVSDTSRYLPDGVDWIEEAVAEFDPEGNKLVTTSGKGVSYDYLVVTTGMKLDYDAIEGMDVSRIGQDGLGSHYLGPEAAAKTWTAMAKFSEEGGQGIFLRPATEMKCAGAPLKFTFLTEHNLRRNGTRSKANLLYAAHSKSLFSVPIVHEKVRMLYKDRGIDTVYNHVLRKVDLDRKIATFDTPNGSADIDYDFLNVIPPMRAPDAVRYSPLAWRTGKFARDGWTEVNKHNLQHKVFPNVWCVGDIAGVPKGKTAASVKWQVPVAVDHILSAIQDKEATSVYNGYTSCPLLTQYGRAMLVEFDYNNDLTPSFPGVIAPLEELWITWVMKTMALKPTYVSMLRGLA